MPFAPLAQATRSDTVLTPRRRALTPLVCGVHWGAKAVNAMRMVMTATDGPSGRSGRIVSMVAALGCRAQAPASSAALELVRSSENAE